MKRQNVIGCVHQGSFYHCLPCLIIIGAFKGGTTGARYKLLASGQFISSSSEGHFWAETCSLRWSVTFTAEKYASQFGKVTESQFQAGSFAVFDDTPRYIDSLNAEWLERIREVVPDVELLLLARAGADIHFSALEMVASDYPDCAPLKPYGNACGKAQATAVAVARQIFTEGKFRAMDFIRDPKHVVIDMKHRSGIYISKGAFVYALERIWKTLPRSQTTVLESEALWARPRESYDVIAKALKLDFTIKLISGTRTRPSRQNFPKCPVSRLNQFKKMTRVCHLKVPFQCAWYSANAMFAEFLNVSWPLRWNDNINESVCLLNGFSASDLLADYRHVNVLSKNEKSNRIESRAG